MAETIRVQVCYATPAHQILREVFVPDGTLLEDAVRLSGILEDCPEIDLEKCRVGIFSKLRKIDAVLRDGDRIEIYRPLIADPKESRRRRAAKK